MCANVAGWALGSLMYVMEQSQQRNADLLPLLDSLRVQGGTASLDRSDPATQHLLAVEEYGMRTENAISFIIIPNAN